MESKEVSTDVLVIGGGPGAMFAAIKAREAGAERVTMVCKAVAGSSGCFLWAQGNVRDYPPDQAESILRHMVEKSPIPVEQDMLERTLKEMHKRVDELREWGVKFMKKRGNETVGGHYGTEPNVFVEGGGIGLLWPMRAQALRV
ncbi:FAD-binding protein, partial [Chloroflexota bacterium]